MLKRSRALAAGGAALAVLALSAVVWAGRTTEAQQQIDISGDWNVEVAGFGNVSCSASIVQTGAAFAMDVECEGLGFGQFDGTIDQESGAFTAVGQLVGFDVELAGTVAPDSETLEGTWSAEMLGLSGTLTAVRKGPVLTPTPLPTLAAPVDVTGTWRISFSGVFGGTCEAVIEQTGTELFSIADCPLVGTQRLSGSLEQTTGTFSLTSGLIEIEGVVAADANTVRGTWTAFMFSGSLTGERADDIELIDANGSWDVVLISTSRQTCALEIDQSLISATGTLDCPDGVVELEGTVDPFGAWVSLSGSLDGQRTSLGARIAADGDYIFGSQLDTSGEQSATFIAVPAGALQRGIVLLNCRPQREFMAVFCGGLVGEKFSTEVHVAVPPAGGYAGVQGALAWSEQLRLDEASLSGQCVEATFAASTTTATFTCPFAEGSSAFEGGLITLSVVCLDSGQGNISIGEGTGFLGPDTALGPPTLISATIECFGPQFGGPAPPVGDANCSYEVDSVDAALVLQYDARLLDALRCLGQADVNRDERVNSLDAALILQYTVGLLDAFP